MLYVYWKRLEEQTAAKDLYFMHYQVMSCVLLLLFYSLSNESYLTSKRRTKCRATQTTIDDYEEDVIS